LWKKKKKHHLQIVRWILPGRFEEYEGGCGWHSSQKAWWRGEGNHCGRWSDRGKKGIGSDKSSCDREAKRKKRAESAPKVSKGKKRQASQN